MILAGRVGKDWFDLSWPLQGREIGGGRGGNVIKKKKQKKNTFVTESSQLEQPDSWAQSQEVGLQAGPGIW